VDAYVCDGCGYLYDPEFGDEANRIAEGTPFEKLPADWVCPECGSPKSEFYPLDEDEFSEAEELDEDYAY
jgi:rubredoxin